MNKIKKTLALENKALFNAPHAFIVISLSNKIYLASLILLTINLLLWVA